MGNVDLPTTKRLFAVSSNLCAFEGCTTKLVTDDSVVVGRICHIKGARPGAPRHDDTQLDAERHGFENLLLLCGAHHDVIDKEKSDEWTVDRLQAMKMAHESASVSHPADEERVCKQLLWNTTIYEQGFRVGTVHAHTVQMAQGDIHNYPASSKVAGGNGNSPSASADAETLKTMVEMVESTDLLQFLTNQDFGASFHAEALTPLDSFQMYSKRTDAEFLAQDLEAERTKLTEAIQNFSADLSRSISGTKMYRIATEDELVKGGWIRSEARDRFRSDQDRLNKLATNWVEQYRDFVAMTRRNLLM